MNRKKRILLVDDEPAFTRLMKLNLECNSAYEVKVENDGGKALAAARAYRPDLIFLDVIMPDVDGGQVAWARVGVRDDGRGIPPGRLRELFKEFVQLDGSMTREAGGLGLGLAAARKIMEAMGGRLTASSEPGRGAAFFLMLPAI